MSHFHRILLVVSLFFFTASISFAESEPEFEFEDEKTILSVLNTIYSFAIMNCAEKGYIAETLEGNGWDLDLPQYDIDFESDGKHLSVSLEYKGKKFYIDENKNHFDADGKEVPEWLMSEIFPHRKIYPEYIRKLDPKPESWELCSKRSDLGIPPGSDH